MNLKYLVPGATIEGAQEVLDAIEGLEQSGDMYRVPRPVPTREPAPEPVKEPQKPSGRTNKQGRGIPTPKVPVKPVDRYGDHVNAILNSRRLREYPSAQHVSFVINREMWLKHGNRGFGKPLEMPLAEVMRLSGLGKAAAAKAVKHAVECGFFQRRDNGNGGRNSANGATYVPTLPDW